MAYFLDHKNVQPFIGIDEDTFRSPPLLCIVTPWQRNGTILNCLAQLQGANIPVLVDVWVRLYGFVEFTLI